MAKENDVANKTGKKRLPLTIVEQINIQGTQVPLYSDGSLNIHDVLLDDFSFLDAIDPQNLRKLLISNCGLKEIPVLSRFNELEDLFLDHNEIRELSNVNGLESLRFLDLSHNNVKI